MMFRLATLISTLPLAYSWNGITEASMSPTLSASSGRCHCPSVALFSNERWPTDDSGGGCTGGCSGAPFTVHKEGAIVRAIHVWSGSNSIAAIQISYFNSLDDVTVGTPANGPTSKSITFQPGETLKGDVTLSGDGHGNVLGYIAFSTSAGQNFAAGNSGHTKYVYDSGNSFISGILGLQGDYIYSLAFLFWKPIQSLYYVGVSYPTLDSQAKVLSPTVIASQEFCNDNDVPRPFAGLPTQQAKVTTGHDSCFSASATETFGMSLSVTAGVPAIESEKTTMSWSISGTQSFKNCDQHSTSSTSTLNFPSPSIAAHTRTSYQYTQWQGVLSSLPFTATLQVKFVDGSSINRTETGNYKGTSYLQVMQSWTKEQKGVQNCNNATVFSDNLTHTLIV